MSKDIDKFANIFQGILKDGENNLKLASDGNFDQIFDKLRFSVANPESYFDSMQRLGEETTRLQTEEIEGKIQGIKVLLDGAKDKANESIVENLQGMISTIKSAREQLTHEANEKIHSDCIELMEKLNTLVGQVEEGVGFAKNNFPEAVDILEEHLKAVVSSVAEVSEKAEGDVTAKLSEFKQEVPSGLETLAGESSTLDLSSEKTDA